MLKYIVKGTFSMCKSLPNQIYFSSFNFWEREYGISLFSIFSKAMTLNDKASHRITTINNKKEGIKLTALKAIFKYSNMIFFLDEGGNSAIKCLFCNNTKLLVKNKKFFYSVYTSIVLK